MRTLLQLCWKRPLSLCRVSGSYVHLLEWLVDVERVVACEVLPRDDVGEGEIMACRQPQGLAGLVKSSTLLQVGIP